VDEIARLIADPAHTGRDIGVISLIGAEQAEKIGRMLVEDVRVGPEKIEKRRIIYGDARTMQGQERSIVFLSMVATPGHAHAQTTKSDQQRINVAMSRAKDRLYLVRSVEADDLKPTDIKSDILRHFLDPMPEGRAASKNEVDDLMERCDSPFEQEVLGRLMAANYRVRPQVAAGGFRIDLVVEGMDDRRLAIELDGDLFHGPDVWDRDMIRQAALERAGWVFWRVFGSQWAADKDFWWANLCNTLDQLKIDPIGATAVDERFTETIFVDPVDIGGAGAEDAPLAHSIETDGEIRAEATGTPDTSQTAADMQGSTSNIQDTRSPTDPDDSVPASTSSKDPDSPNPSSQQRGRSTQQPLPLDTEDDLFSLAASSPESVEVADAAAGTPESDSTDRRPDPVRIGDTIRLEKLGIGGGMLEITLVDDGHDASNGMIGIHTPLGQALLDAEVGDEVEYRAGAYVQEVRVLSIA
jgi:very-short-patch-repair endonuclease